MTCPTWSDLVARRETEEAAVAWREAVSHLGECGSCREEALRADPTLVFRSLPTVEISSDDIASMRKRVALLRRAKELETIESPLRERGSARWAGPARVASLLLLVGSMTVVSLRAPGDEVLVVDGAGVVDTTPVELPDSLRAEPVLEGADRPFDQVVEWTHADLSLVVLVDERLDV